VRRPATNYLEILQRRQLAVRVHEPWVSVGSPRRRQGWKLHLSTMVSEAPQLLRAVLPVLEEAGVDFKVVIDSDRLVRLNEGTLGETQVGKFGLGGGGLVIGRSGAEPVVDGYPGERPWPLVGGTVKRVLIDVSGEPFVDLAREAQAAYARQ